MAWVGDYSWSRPSPRALTDAGCVGVIRYLGPGNGGRDVTRTEIAGLHAAGLGTGLVWETTTTAALAGWQAGWNDVASANHHADALGYPDHLPIFYAVDTDVNVAQIRGPVADTFRGAIQASKRPVRPYGEADVLDILCGELRLMPCGWQCAAWSGRKLSAYRCMYQRWPPIMHETVDHNELGPHPTDFLWHPHIRYDLGDDHMTDEDWAKLRTIVSEEVGGAVAALGNVQTNLSNENRGEHQDTRKAGVDDGAETRQLVRDTAAEGHGDLERMQTNLGTVLGEMIGELQQSGIDVADIDVDALAATIAGKLTVTTE